MSRTIDGNSQRAYRIAKVRFGRTEYIGPYSTLGAAKGMMTREKRWTSYDNSPTELYIEQTPEGWERVE